MNVEQAQLMTRLNTLEIVNKRLQNEVADHNDFMAFLRDGFSRLPCCHEEAGPDAHAGTPPMMWVPELVVCIARRYHREQLKNQLAPFMAIASGIPTNWPAECVLRFDYNGDRPAHYTLSYHGINDVKDGITIGQWRALLGKEKNHAEGYGEGDNRASPPGDADQGPQG